MPPPSLTVRIVLALAALLWLPGAVAQSSPDPIGGKMPYAKFDGWVEQSYTPQPPPPEDAAALKEFGLRQSAAARFVRGGRDLNVVIFEFPDATGAYGAFTYYRTSGMREDGMREEKIGSGGVSSANRYLFWTGSTLVEAVSGQSGARTARELNDFAAALPKVAGPESVPPSLPGYLPGGGLDAASIHYSIGPIAYQHGGGTLPLNLIDFSRDAEVVTAEYRNRSGSGTLTLINYPTPAIAVNRARAIADAVKSGSFVSGDRSALLVRRAGPLIAITTGHFAAAEARRLLDEIRYNAGIVWSSTIGGGGTSEASKAASLLLSIAYLTVMIAVAALVLGVFLGGGRALIRKLRGKPISSLNDEDFISLKLGG